MDETERPAGDGGQSGPETPAAKEVAEKTEPGPPAAEKQEASAVGESKTLTPAGASFQDWQVAQLTALESALSSGG